MDHLLHYIKKEVAISDDSGTIYVELPKGAQISQLVIEIRMGRTTTSGPTVSVLTDVDKIHVLLDGAKIAYTMQPEVGSFDYFLRAGQNPPHELTSIKSTWDTMRLPILFGRYPGDPEYGLDTGLYGTAVVEIEYTMDTTYYRTGEMELTAYILIPVAPVSYRGFIRSRIIEDKATPTASSVHTTDFPSTHPLLAAFVRIYDWDAQPNNNVTDLDFQAEQGKYRIFNGRIQDLMTMNDMILGTDLPSPIIKATAGTGNSLITFMAKAYSAIVTSNDTLDELWSVYSHVGHRITVRKEGTAADRSVHYQAFGAMPWGCLLLGDWRNAPFDAPAHADLKCDYAIGSTTPEFLTTCVLEVVEGVL